MNERNKLGGRYEVVHEAWTSDPTRRIAKKQGATRIYMKKVSPVALLALCFLLFATLLGFATDDALVGMLVATAQIACIFAYAKLSFFSVFSALLTFCLFQEYAAVSGFQVNGVLGLGVVPYYFNELKVCVYTFNLLTMLLILFTEVLEREHELLRTRFVVSDRASILFIVMAVAITLLVFPSLPSFLSFSSGNRFSSGILPFSGWSIVPFFLLSAAIGNSRNRMLGAIASIFVIAWYAFHGERVETIGFAVLLAVRYYVGNKNRHGTGLKLAVVAAIIVPVFVAIGSLRTGSYTLSIGELLRSIAIQSTACDVTYVFNCAVDLYYRGIQLGGGTYLSYLVNCIPLLEDPYAFATVIERYYFTPGGGLFFAEAIANFGFLFSAVCSLVYLALVAAVIARGGTWSYLVYSTLMICVFRSAWYGLNYPITTIVYFIPLVMVVSKLLGIPGTIPLSRDGFVDKGTLRSAKHHLQSAPEIKRRASMENTRTRCREYGI